MICKCGKKFIPAAHGKSALMCKICVTNRRIWNVKKRAIEFLGGKCTLCGYNKCPDAFDFHHLDPTQKEFGIADAYCISWDRLVIELKKCQLLCSNCHREIHYQERIQRRFDEESLDVNFQENKDCLICKKQFTSLKSDNQLYCSNKCAGTARIKVNWPSINDLIEKIKNSSYLQVSMELGVCDNAVRKHLKKHKIDPKSIRSIKDNRFVKEN